MTATYLPRFETQTDQRAPLPWTNCTFAAGAMLLDHWTWGVTRTDDIYLRNASGIPVSLGSNFAGLRRAILNAFGASRDLRYSEPDQSGNANIRWRDLRTHLSTGGAAAVAGSYAKLSGFTNAKGQQLTRWQPGGNFGHAMLAVDYNVPAGTVRLYDPLGRGDYDGDVAPLTALWAFIYKQGNDADAFIAAAHGFAGARPSMPVTIPKADDFAGKISAFGTRYPLYVHSCNDALEWTNRNVRRLREAGAIRGY